MKVPAKTPIPAPVGINIINTITKENEMYAVTILLVIGIGFAFHYTSKSSVKHNQKIIKWLKQNNDKSGRYII